MNVFIPAFILIGLEILIRIIHLLIRKKKWYRDLIKRKVNKILKRNIMDKIHTKEYACTMIVHEFYCDECKKKLGEAEEFDMGCYNYPDDVYALKHINHRGFITFQTEFKPNDLCYCKDCYNKKKDEFIKIVLDSGLFKRDEEIYE